MPASGALPPFEMVLREHGPTVLAYLRAHAGPHADDAYQETMLAALRSYEQLRDPEAVKAWLLTIASRKAADAHRAAARAPQPVEDIAELAGAADPPEADNGIWQHVRALPPRQRQAVTLRYLAGLTHREAATVLGISEAAARRAAADGLARLRHELEPHEPELAGVL